MWRCKLNEKKNLFVFCCVVGVAALSTPMTAFSFIIIYFKPSILFRVQFLVNLWRITMAENSTPQKRVNFDEAFLLSPSPNVKDLTKFSCKFCKEDLLINTYNYSYIQLQIHSWLLGSEIIVIQTAVYIAERFMLHWNFS